MIWLVWCAVAIDRHMMMLWLCINSHAHKSLFQIVHISARKKQLDELPIIAAHVYILHGSDASCVDNRILKRILRLIDKRHRTDWHRVNWLQEEEKNDGGKRIVRDFDVDTYTSTRTGKAASRNSSRQLGGYRICTWIRVPWFNVISNECFFGSASLSRRCLIDEFPMLNSSCNNIFVLIECTPTHQEKRDERERGNGTIEAIKIYPIMIYTPKRRR